MSTLSHFDEKSGVVYSPISSCPGFSSRWYQTVTEVVVEVNRDEDNGNGDIRAKGVNVVMKPKKLTITINNSSILDGEPYDVLLEDECTWTIEDRRLLRVHLCKASKDKKLCWPSVLKNDESSKADTHTFHEMRKKIDLEIFQMENPGFDFSGAKLDKRYEDRGLKEAAAALRNDCN